MTIPPGQMSYAVERLPYDYFAFGEYVQLKTMEAMRVMKEDIYFEYAVFGVNSGWYLKEGLDELVLVIQQSGIQKYWLMVTTYKQLDPSVQKGIGLSNMHHQGAEAKSMEITRLLGIFLILIFGLTVSVLVFIAELVFGKRGNRILR